MCSVLGFCISISSCNKVGDCFKSTGKIVVSERSVSAFDSIKVEDNVEVILIQDSVYRVIIESGEHLQSEIVSEVSNGRLHLTNDNSCNWVRNMDVHIKAYVHFVDLSIVTNKSVSTVSSPDSIIIKNHFFQTRTISTGDFDLKGRFDYLIINTWVAMGNTYISGEADLTEIWCTGSSRIDARNLKSKSIGIYTDTPADCYVYATENLGATPGWTGNIYYRGNPVNFNIKEPSQGRVIKMD